MANLNVKLILDYINKNKPSKAKFCKLCGISSYNLKKILNNDKSIKIVPLLKVLKVLNISSCSFIID